MSENMRDVTPQSEPNSEVPKQENRRKARSLLFSPRMQIKYGMYYMGIGLATVFVANLTLVYLLVNVVNMGNTNDPGTAVGGMLVNSITQNIQPIALGSTVVCFLLLGFSFLMTKHVVGPMHALIKHVEELKKGNFSYKTTLRRGDEFKPMMEALNELSDSLSKR